MKTVDFISQMTTSMRTKAKQNILCFQNAGDEKNLHSAAGNR